MSRSRVESKEHQIVTGLIKDTKFFKLISPLLNTNYFEDPYLKTFIPYLIKYFEKNGKAPGKDTKSLLLDHRSHYKNKDVTINDFLKEELADAYKSYVDIDFKNDFIISTCLDFLNRQANKHHIEALKAADGDADKIKELIDKKEKLDRSGRNEYINLMDDNGLKSMFKTIDQVDMLFDGILGLYLNPIKKGLLICLFAATKVGKTHWSEKFAFTALCCGLKVIFYSIEMTEDRLREDFIKIITGRIPSEVSTENFYKIPVWDCIRNQLGFCTVTNICEGSNRDIFDHKLRAPKPFEECPQHKPCSICRQHPKERFHNLYMVSSWFQEVKRKTITLEELKNYPLLNEIMNKNKMRLKTGEKGPTSFEDIELFIKQQKDEGWIPDVLIIDSPDSLSKDRKAGQFRHQIGDLWLRASNLAKAENLIVLATSQSNRDSWDKSRNKNNLISEDASKIMVADVAISVNSRVNNNKNEEDSLPTQGDKYWGRQEIEITAHRHKDFNSGQQIMTLNCFDVNQLCIDAHPFVYKNLVPTKKTFEQWIKGNF